MSRQFNTDKPLAVGRITKLYTIFFVKAVVKDAQDVEAACHSACRQGQ
jgi:hypothetical protein